MIGAGVLGAVHANFGGGLLADAALERGGFGHGALPIILDSAMED
jgi:hypothetical protein